MPARCSRSPVSMAPAAQAAFSRTWARRRGAIQRRRSDAPPPAARQYAAGPRPGRLRVDQGPAVRAVLQSRQEGRAQLPRLGLGHGLRLLRFPSPGRGADADGARGGAAAVVAPADAAGAIAAEVAMRVETPKVASARIEPVRSEARAANPRLPNRRSRKPRRNCASRPTEAARQGARHPRQLPVPSRIMSGVDHRAGRAVSRDRRGTAGLRTSCARPHFVERAQHPSLAAAAPCRPG